MRHNNVHATKMRMLIVKRGTFSWGEGASLALVGNPSSDGVTIKMPYPPRV